MRSAAAPTPSGRRSGCAGPSSVWSCAATPTATTVRAWGGRGTVPARPRPPERSGPAHRQQRPAHRGPTPHQHRHQGMATGGEVEQLSGAGATTRLWGGTYKWKSTTTIGTELTIGSSGKLDRSEENRSATVTPVIQLHKGAVLSDPNASITFTAGFKCNGCKLQDCQVDVGSGRTFTVA